MQRSVRIPVPQLVVFALACCLGACSAPDREAPVSQTSDDVSFGACAATLAGGTVVPVRLDIPSALVSESFQGLVPITFGVPFPKGLLRPNRRVWLRQAQATSSTVCRRLTQTKVTSTWPADASGGPWVKWLLVDGLVEISGGVAKPVELIFDDANAPPPTIEAFPWNTGFANRVASGTQPTGALPTNVVGSFGLVTTHATPLTLNATPTSAVLETKVDNTVGNTADSKGDGVRTVYLEKGEYRPAGGGTPRVGQYRTRFDFYNGLPFVRLRHTLIWGRDGIPADENPGDPLGFDYEKPLNRLRYLVPGVSPTCTAVRVGRHVADYNFPGGCSVGRVTQFDEETTEQLVGNTATSVSDRLLGWMRVTNSTAPFPSDVFVGLRSAREQFPTGFSMGASPGATTEVRLLDANGKNWWALASNAESQQNPPSHSGLAALGIAKTYDLLLWPGGLGTPTPAVRNAFAQGGVLANVDPDFAVKAGLPLPMNACVGSACTSAPTKAGTVERAMANAFSFATRERLPGSPTVGHSRFGALNFGDTFYQYLRNDENGQGSGRYWMNLGAGFSALPWVLWMRSGDRRYREFGEANARHVMDVDTQHVNRILTINPLWGPHPVATLAKFAGAQVAYALDHGGLIAVDPGQSGYTVSKSYEADGIALFYQLTGDERALEVLRLRAQRIQTQYGDPASSLMRSLSELQPTSWTTTPLTFPNPPPNPYPLGPLGYYASANTKPPSQDGPQPHFRTLAELCILHEVFAGPGAHPYPNLIFAADAYARALVSLMDASGGWIGPGRAHWMEQALAIAMRVLPNRADDIQRVLAKFDERQGNVGAATPPVVRNGAFTYGKSYGPRSLVSTLARYDRFGDPRVLRSAQDLVYTQALSVHDASSASMTSWTGSAHTETDFLVADIRDWLLVRARELSPGVAFAPQASALAYLERALYDNNTATAPANPDRGLRVNRAYAAKSEGEELYLGIDMNFANGGYRYRNLWVDSYAGGTPIATGQALCAAPREVQFFAELMGYQDPTSVGACAGLASVPDEGALYRLPASEDAKGGVYRFDVSQSIHCGASVLCGGATPFCCRTPSVPATFSCESAKCVEPAQIAADIPELPLSFEASVVRPSSNSGLAFAIAGTAVGSTPRLQGRDKMTLAAAVRTAGGGTQTVLEKLGEYVLTVNGASATASFTLKSGASTSVVSHTAPVTTTGASLVPIVATLRRDETTNVVVSLCTVGGCTSTTTTVAATYHLTPGASALTLGRGTSSSTLDEVRVLDRILSDTERQYLFGPVSATGPALWTAHAKDLGGGEIFLFDRNFEGLTGDVYTPTTTPTYVGLTGSSRPARFAPNVQYDNGADKRPYDLFGSVQTDPNFVGGRILPTNWSRGVGVLFAAPIVPAAELGMGKYVGTRGRFGLVGVGGELWGPTIPIFPPTVPDYEKVPTLGAGTTLPSILPLLVGASMGTPTGIVGFGPLYSRDKNLWFDAISCESDRNDTVAHFGSTGTLPMGTFSKGTSYSLSFKMKAQSAPSTVAVLEKAGELRFEQLGSTLTFTHTTTAGAVSISATIPLGQWATYTATVDAVRVRLFVNGRSAASAPVSAIPATNPPAVLRAGPLAPNGLIDDIWVEPGAMTPAAIERLWSVCEPASPAASNHPTAFGLTYQSFEGACPSGTAGFGCEPR
jgi:hypothetical protein